MKKHSFAIIASGLDPEADDFEDRFFEAGCDDATISVQKGVIVLDFNREARNFSHAVVSAVHDVERAGARADHVEPDHLVNASEIAKRVGVGRAAVSLYAEGRRGEGFPRPVRRIKTDGPLWDFVEVALWFRRRKKVDRGAVVEAKIVREVNRVLSAGEPGRSRLARQLRASAERDGKASA